jgi:hypothetical protein
MRASTKSIAICNSDIWITKSKHKDQIEGKVNEGKVNFSPLQGTEDEHLRTDAIFPQN